MTEGGLRARLWGYLPILLVLAAGAVAYVTQAVLQNADLDEGNYLLAAVQIAHGQLPFVNFVGIEPVVPFYLSAGVLAFGPSLVVARLQMVALVLLTAAGVYRLGRSHHSEGAGLLAASVFLFSPLSLYYAPIVILESASLAPLVFAATLLLRKKADSPWVASVAIGVLVGVAALARRDTALLLPLFLVVAALRARGWNRLWTSIALMAGFLAMVGSVLGYFAARTSVAWINAQYGVGAAYSATSIPLAQHYGVLAYGVLTLPALAVGMMGVLTWQLRSQGRPREARWALGFAGVPTLIVLAYGLSYQSWGQGEFDFVYLGGAFLVIAVAWILLRIDLSSAGSPTRARGRLAVPFLAAWFAAIVIFFTFVYPAFYVHYLIEVTLPASLLVGFFFADRFAATHTAPASGPAEAPPDGRTNSKRRWRLARGRRWSPASPTVRGLLLALLLVVPSTAAGILILGPTNPYNNPYANGLAPVNLYQRVYPVSELEAVANYVDAHSAANATIFTADALFAAEANRLVLLNLSTIIDDYVYASTPHPMNWSPFGTNSYGLAPTLSEIFGAWNRTYVPLVVVGSRTLNMMTTVPYLQYYVAERYHPVAVFGPGFPTQVVTVEALGRGPSGGSLTTSVPAFQNPSSVVVDPGSGVGYLGDARNASIEIVSASGGVSWTSLPSPYSGVLAMQLAPSLDALAVATPENALLVYAVAPLGALTLSQVVPVPAAVTVLAFGAGSTILYGLSPTSSEVLEVDLSNSSVRPLITGLPSTSAFAVDPASDLLAVAENQTADVSVYNLTSGVHLQDYGLGVVAADQVAFEGSTLVGVQESPAVAIRLNLSTGLVWTSPNQGGPSQGFAAAGGLILAGGSGDGLVTVYNTSTGNLEGYVMTGSCIGAMAYDPGLRALWVASPCGSTAEVWTLASSVPYPVTAPSGTSLFANGAELPEPGAVTLLPGVYEIQANANGGTAAALISVSGPGALSISAPDKAAEGLSSQVVFLAVVVPASAVAVVALVWAGVRRPTVFSREGEAPGREPA